MVATWQTVWPPPKAALEPHDERNEPNPPLPAAGEDSKQVAELDAILIARVGPALPWKKMYITNSGNRKNSAKGKRNLLSEAGIYRLC